MRAEFPVELPTHGALSVHRSPCGPGLLVTHQIVQLGSQSLGGTQRAWGLSMSQGEGNQCSLSACWSGPVPAAGFTGPEAQSLPLRLCQGLRIPCTLTISRE